MPDTSVLKRLLQGGGASAYGSVVAVVVQLVGVPILLHAWGAQLYGEWLVLFAIPAYLSLTNLGYSLAIANEMTMRIARGDRAGTLAAFQSLIALVTITGLLVGAALLLAMTLLPVPDWLGLHGIAPHAVRATIVLLGLEVLLQLLGGVASAGFRAVGDFGLGVALGTSVQLLQYVALWGVALAGFGVTAAAAAFMGVRLLGYPPVLLVLARRHPWLRLGFRAAEWRLIRMLGGPSLANLMLTLANALKNQGLVLVVNALLGPIAVAVFSVTRTLTRLPLRAVYVVSQAIEPELARASGAANRMLEHRLFQTGLRAGLWLAVGAGLLLYIAGDDILRLWTHGRIAFDGPLFLWLTGSAICASLWHSALSGLQALNRHQRAVWGYVVGACAMLGLSWVLAAAVGKVQGVGLAMFVGDALLAAYVVREASRVINIPLADLCIRAANPLPLWNDVRIIAVRARARAKPPTAERGT